MKRINVLQFICPSGFYGAEMWVLALSSHLDKKLVNCSLAVTHESQDQNLELFDRFMALGLNAYKIPMLGRFDVRSIPRLVKLIKKQKIDIMHTHGYKSDILGLITGRIAGIKIISTPHGFENAKNFKLQMFIKIGCFALRFYDKIVPLSPDLRQNCLDLKVSPAKIKMIINGVDLTEIEAERSKKHIPFFSDKKEKIIGYVGQMAYRKNIDAMLSAFDLLYRETQDIRLVLVGDGALRAQLEERAKKLSSYHKIDFLGFRNDRLRIVKEMDIFCMTSSLEGIPRCIMEAMAMGTPVVAFNIPGIDKLVLNGKTGLLADFDDVDGLKENFKQLLDDKLLSTEITRNARTYILEKFSARRMAQEYTGVYEELLNQMI